ncbi:MAG TPA: enoyl-CoA hydratase/isomerase family protein [Candidatus Limnocylindria bacterium]|nr:enoyl-CoA hydratase/isomerase family protein [Candidatus Limnocylindria bacterium]
MSTDVRYEVRDGIAHVTFDRQQARNAMTFAMYEDLYEIAQRVNADKAVRALILTGAGNAFVAGTDISQFKDFSTEEQAIAYEEKMDRILGALEDVRVPTIAAIGGATTGGGLAIAAACDLRVASADATFGMPIARTLGNCLSLANLVRIASLIGVARTKELIFTARLLSSEEALRVGLVSEVVPAGEVAARAEELARTVSGHAPLTLWATKEGLRRVRQRLLPDEGRDLVLLCYTSADFREGVRAFMEKRKPEWRGK